MTQQEIPQQSNDVEPNNNTSSSANDNNLTMTDQVEGLDTSGPITLATIPANRWLRQIKARSSEDQLTQVSKSVSYLLRRGAKGEIYTDLPFDDLNRCKVKDLLDICIRSCKVTDFDNLIAVLEESNKAKRRYFLEEIDGETFIKAVHKSDGLGPVAGDRNSHSHSHSNSNTNNNNSNNTNNNLNSHSNSKDLTTSDNNNNFHHSIVRDTKWQSTTNLPRQDDDDLLMVPGSDDVDVQVQDVGIRNNLSSSNQSQNDSLQNQNQNGQRNQIRRYQVLQSEHFEKVIVRHGISLDSEKVGVLAGSEIVELLEPPKHLDHGIVRIRIIGRRGIKKSDIKDLKSEKEDEKEEKDENSNDQNNEENNEEEEEENSTSEIIGWVTQDATSADGPQFLEEVWWNKNINAYTNMRYGGKSSDKGKGRSGNGNGNNYRGNQNNQQNMNSNQMSNSDNYIQNNGNIGGPNGYNQNQNNYFMQQNMNQNQNQQNYGQGPMGNYNNNQNPRYHNGPNQNFQNNNYQNGPNGPGPNQNQNFNNYGQNNNLNQMSNQNQNQNHNGNGYNNNQMNYNGKNNNSKGKGKRNHNGGKQSPNDTNNYHKNRQQYQGGKNGNQKKSPIGSEETDQNQTAATNVAAA